MGELKKIISSFKLRDELNPKLWDNDDNGEPTLKDDVREKLLNITYEFLEFLDVDLVISDITMTGSLSNYNWSEYSDVDLHIIADFEQFNDIEEPLYEELFRLKKTLFNTEHDISIYGYEVEVYVQNENEPHSSSGVYSVLFDEWVVKPVNDSVVLVDKESITKKSKRWMETIDTILENIKDGSIEEMTEKINMLKDKIKKFRTSGLQEGGEYSDENLVFKTLRRNGYIGKIFDFKTKYIDKELTLTEMMLESSTPRNIIAKKWLTNNYGDLERYKMDKYPRTVFYMKDGMVIFDYTRKDGRCHISYAEIWSFLESVFKLGFEEIKAITKEWVEEHYKLEVTRTGLIPASYASRVEEHYKLNNKRGHF